MVLMTADTIGGVWQYALELAAALGTHGVRIALATMGAPLTAAQRAEVSELGHVTVHESAYRLEWMPESSPHVRRAGEWLLELERRLAPDVVHLNQFAFGALPFAAPALVVAHSCVLSWWQAVHGTPAPAEWDRYRTLVRNGLAGARLVIAPTRAMLSSVELYYGMAPGLVIPNARSQGRYRPGPKQAVIFSAGRLWDAAKNVAALDAIADRLPWPVRVAGSMLHPDGHVQEPRHLDVLGKLSTRAMSRELARTAIYALPARYEPFGLSVLEAALAGCALVLGDIPSLREVWGPAAVYVDPNEPSALGAILARLIADRALRQGLAHAARARALTYTPERQAKAYLEAYATALASARDPHQSTTSGEFHACAS